MQNMFVREGVNFGGKELSIETGRMAKQADGSVVVRYGDTMVLVTAVASSAIRPGVDFMPLGFGQQPRRYVPGGGQQRLRPHRLRRDGDDAVRVLPAGLDLLPYPNAILYPDLASDPSGRTRGSPDAECAAN